MTYYRQSRWAERALFQAKENMASAAKHLEIAGKSVDRPKDWSDHNCRRAEELMNAAEALIKEVGDSLGREHP